MYSCDSQLVKYISIAPKPTTHHKRSMLESESSQSTNAIKFIMQSLTITIPSYYSILL